MPEKASVASERLQGSAKGISPPPPARLRGIGSYVRWRPRRENACSAAPNDRASNITV